MDTLTLCQNPPSTKTRLHKDLKPHGQKVGTLKTSRGAENQKKRYHRNPLCTLLDLKPIQQKPKHHQNSSEHALRSKNFRQKPYPPTDTYPRKPPSSNPILPHPSKREKTKNRNKTPRYFLGALDVNRNPLPDHQKLKINVVDSDPELQIEKDVKAVCMPIGTVYKALLKAVMLEEEQEKKEKKEDGEGQYCQYHKRTVGHSI